MGAWLTIAYIVIGCFFAVMTWIDNSQTYYTRGDPPSGLLTGVFWPVVLLLVGLWWLFDPFREPFFKSQGPDQ